MYKSKHTKTLHNNSTYASYLRIAILNKLPSYRMVLVTLMSSLFLSKQASRVVSKLLLLSPPPLSPTRPPKTYAKNRHTYSLDYTYKFYYITNTTHSMQCAIHPSHSLYPLTPRSSSSSSITANVWSSRTPTPPLSQTPPTLYTQ